MTEALLFDNSMPFSLEAEQAVLGAILVDPAAIDTVSSVIRREDFRLSEHVEIYGAMMEMYRKSRSIDVVLLIDELVRGGVYDAAGGEAYVRALAEAVPVVSNVREYAEIVRDKAMLRRIIEVTEEINRAAHSGIAGSQVLESAEELIYGLSVDGADGGFVHIRDAVMSVYQRLSDIKQHPEKVRGTVTGFDRLDDLIVGMTGGDLILVGARPGMGKTAFAMNIATEAAMATKKAVCVFSLEMTSEQIANRMISSEAMIDSSLMRTGQLNEDGWASIAHAASRMAEMEILIDDSCGATVSSMRSKLRKVKNLGLIVVDYLQLMHGERKSENRVLEIAEISRGLKLLAKEMNVPVICCAQLSRAVEQRKDKRPMLSDLRDSGAIEQDADVVMFLYRDDYYETEPMPQSVAEVIVAKNRHGSNGAAKVGWIGRFTKFTNLDRRM